GEVPLGNRLQRVVEQCDRTILPCARIVTIFHLITPIPDGHVGGDALAQRDVVVLHATRLLLHEVLAAFIDHLGFNHSVFGATAAHFGEITNYGSLALELEMKPYTNIIWTRWHCKPPD